MTDAERDNVIAMLVETLGQISRNVETLAGEMKRLIAAEKERQAMDEARDLTWYRQ